MLLRSCCWSVIPGRVKQSGATTARSTPGRRSDWDDLRSLRDLIQSQIMVLEVAHEAESLNGLKGKSTKGQTERCLWIALIFRLVSLLSSY